MIGFSCMDFKTTCVDQSISLDLEENTTIAREEIPPAIEAFSSGEGQGQLYRSERISMEAYRPSFRSEV